MANEHPEHPYSGYFHRYAGRRRNGQPEPEGETLANLVTNARGRIATFSAEPLPAGRYCLTAETGAWFARAGRESVFTRAQIDFVIGEAAEDHFHLPFLIAPGGWSTYRGS